MFTGLWLRPDIVHDGRQLVGRDDAADLVLDLRHDLVGVLDTGAGGCAGVQRDLAAIHAGEEIAAQEREQHHRHRDRAQKPKTNLRRLVIASARRLRYCSFTSSKPRSKLRCTRAST